MSDGLRRHAANALTSLRVVSTPAFVVAAYLADKHPSAKVATIVLFVAVALSDFFDGKAARRWGTATDRGRFFDHFADIGFILSALSTYVVLGLAPWWVP